MLCGSTRFRTEFEDASRHLALAGKIVLSVAGFWQSGAAQFAGEHPGVLDELHRWKIDLADRVLVINPGGYIGVSTARELSYAGSLMKPIDYLVQPAQDWCPIHQVHDGCPPVVIDVPGISTDGGCGATGVRHRDRAR